MPRERERKKARNSFVQSLPQTEKQLRRAQEQAQTIEDIAAQVF
jgi:hypothetical protein